MDDACSAFSFFVALFSQVFHVSKSIFSNEFVELHEESNGKRVSYKKKYDVCCHGSVKTTISYLTPRLERMGYDEDEKIIRDVYDSVTDNFGVDFSTNSNGYYLKGGNKTLFEEHAIYGKITRIESYEDRGYKHLYEKNHLCRGSRVCKICQKRMCEGGKCKDESMIYKQDNIFQLENEEMSCDNVNVNYHKLSEFYGQRNAIDVKLKFNSYTTLIPPPLPDEIKGT